MRPLNRPQPLGPAQAYKTYQVVAPLESHFRRASCSEVDCPAYLHGWQTVIDTSTDLGKAQAHYLQHEAGRRFTAESAGDLVTYTFEAGQECFREHSLRLENRPEIYIVKDGDWRLSDNVRRHANADDWLDDFANHQDHIKTRLERG